MNDINNLSYRKFTGRSEADKAINSLKGILLGINFDSIINDLEIQELDNWCSKHQDLINRNPFKEFMILIKASIKNISLRQNTLDDLYWLCQKYEHDSIYYNAVTCDLQTLEGICHGIIADGVINDSEIHELQTWLNANEHLISFYPYDELSSLISSVLEDGKIDDNERTLLLAYFNEFTSVVSDKIKDKIKDEISSVQISAICTLNPQVEFTGKKFCFTGEPKKAQQKDLEQIVENLGGM
jgi:NAD-dependent DNA ligase